MLVLDTQTRFARVRVRDSGTLRSLAFVRDGGAEVVQSVVDLARPHVLQVDYLQGMVECHRLVDSVRDALVIGLGGGGLVHHYRHFYRHVRMDVVELDPGIIAIAGDYFGVRSGGNVRIAEADACEFVQQPGSYDVIYVDAFARPSDKTTTSGAVLCFQQPPFLAALRSRLRPGGAAAFNCHEGHDDVAGIRRGFPKSYVLLVPGAQIVIGMVG